MFDFLKWVPINKRLLYNKATLKCEALPDHTPEYITTDPENFVSECPDNVVLSHQRISQRGVRTSVEKQLFTHLVLEGAPYHTRISKRNL